jgi:PKD repeat protein
MALALSLAATQAASAHQLAPSTRTRYAQGRRACPPPKPGWATCFALVRVPVPSEDAANVGVRPYTLDDGASESGPAGGLTPAQLASAYDFSPTEGGTGQTVALVDAYDDPKIEKDLQTFDKNYKLAECTAANGCFKKVGQTGSTTSLPEADTSGWSVEISLDVETVRGVCPNCKILLVETDAATTADLAAGVNEAVALGATEVSNSYGGPELRAEGESIQAAYNHPGVVIAASTGDEGYYDWDALNEGHEVAEMPNSPASLPSVVAVGGTSLHLDQAGARERETVWNNNGPGDEPGLKDKRSLGATGGGCSTLFTAQLWQQDVPGFPATGCGTKRLDADIAADADPDTGFDIYDSYDCGSSCTEFGVPGWLTVGGTSLSSPLITALYALAGGSNGVRYPALTLYGHAGQASALYDVTEGGNGYCDAEAKCTPDAKDGKVDCEGTSACDAGAGFDGPSGLGTPNGLAAFKPRLPTAVITPPSKLRAGAAASFSASASSDPYPGGSISSYAWSWGDGTAAGTGVSPTHTFAAPGAYTVTLTVTDNYGLSSTQSSQSVNVIQQSRTEEEGEEAAKVKREAEEAATHKQEEEAAAKAKQEAEANAAKEHEEEAAAQARREQEAALTTQREEERSPLSASIQDFPDLPASAPPVAYAKLASTSLSADSEGTVAVRVSCPAADRSCTGTVALRTLGAHGASVAAAAAGKAVGLALATARFTVPGGKVKTVTLHLSSTARRLLARLRVLHARATIVAHDSAGATHTLQALVTLRAASPRDRDG